MTNSSRGLRWRAAFTIASVGFVLMYLFASGRIGNHIVQIDYSWGGDYLDGAPVEIDGVVVGTLEGPSKQRVVGFEVEPGEHVVRVAHPDCEGKPDTLEIGGDFGRFVVLMADVDDGSRCRVLLR